MPEESSRDINVQAEELVELVLTELVEVAEARPGSEAALLRAAKVGTSFLRDVRAGRSTGIQLRNLFKVLLCLEIEPLSFMREALGDLAPKSAPPESAAGKDRPACVQRGLEGRTEISPRGEKVKRRFGIS